MFEVPLVTSVVHDPDSIPLFAKIGVQALANPRRIIAEHLFRAIEHPTIRSLIRIGEEAEVFEVRVAAGAPITGKTLAQAAQEGLFKEGLLIVAIEPSSGGNPVVPGGSSRVAEGDRLTVYSETGATAAVTDLFGHFEGNLDEGGTDQEQGEDNSPVGSKALHQGRQDHLPAREHSPQGCGCPSLCRRCSNGSLHCLRNSVIHFTRSLRP